jgi:hypothetical protein
MANPLEKEQPFVRGNLTRLKILLGCNATQAWKIIGTPKGLASWFPTSVKGSIVPGRTIKFGWPTGSEEHRVLSVKKGKSWVMDWWETGRVKYSIKRGTPIVFTLEAWYPKKGKGTGWQQQEAAGWALFLANLKSKSVRGPDLRSKNAKYSWQRGFVD